MLDFSYLKARPVQVSVANGTKQKWFMTERSKPLPSNRFTSKQRRAILKTELLHDVPYCTECGRELSVHPDQENSAHLVRDRLSCPQHVKQVRVVAKSEKEERRRSEEERRTALTNQEQDWLKLNPFIRGEVSE